MAAAPSTPRRTSTGRRRGRPPGSTNASRAARMAVASSEPPPKRRKYIPGGPGGGGRFVDEDGNVTYVVRGAPRASPGGAGGGGGSRSATAPRRAPAVRAPKPPASSPILPRRERSTRTRIAVSRYEPDDEEQFSSAAAVAAAVVQSEGYKPREERGWEEFHPNLDIETTFMVFPSEEVDGTAPRPSATATPTAGLSFSGAYPFANGGSTSATSHNVGAIATPTLGGTTDTNGGLPNGDANNTLAATSFSTDASQHDLTAASGSPSATSGLPETPLRRRIGRPPRDGLGLGLITYGLSTTPKTPKVLPIHNQTPKEKLDLKLPSYRKTDRILLFEGKTAGRYVDKSMMNVGYQESDVYVRPDPYLIKASDANAEEEIDAYHHHAAAEKSASAGGGGAGSAATEAWGASSSLPTAYGVPGSSVSLVLAGGGAGSNGGVGRVEYDMDEQDDMWLVKLNVQRKAANVEPITREIFEITITKIEKEWHALEKRIPKPNPKPPQTHRPRSSSAAAVNGETQGGEEQDSKCAICDDGDCENTNAIVFCDGCDLAVHQDCYGVPFIPEGQWMCRKCQLIGRGVPTCIFCPNTDGAFKQTNSSKWAHMLCAMWIPETSLGNTTFMEPVMDVEKVPKTRWRLTCYICRQKMGACIQCGNKACYQAFHVTCARRARLYLKMKNSQGNLAILDNSMILKAFCDRHCPADYAKENNVHQATREAKRHYKRTMRGRIWADSRASALQMAATTHALVEHPVDESQMTGARITAALGAAAAAAAHPTLGDDTAMTDATSNAGGDKKKGAAAAAAKPMWRLPSGAPVIPQAVFDIVETALQRFMLRRRREFVAEACRYWTLKREARRGAALLKRLQLQMETFTSMELTRRNFATMGASGQARLERRIEFAESLLADIDRLRGITGDLVERERDKLALATLEQDFVNTCYFPIHQLLAPVIDKASFYDKDKDVFRAGFAALQAKLQKRFYTNTLAFVQDLSTVVRSTINAVLQDDDGKSTPPAEADASTELLANGATPAGGLPAASAATPAAALAEARDRKRLAKRILKAIQPLLEAAVRAEADITRVPPEPLQKELEQLLEASVEIQSASAAAPARSSASAALADDTIMMDRPDDADGDGEAGGLRAAGGQIVVASSSSAAPTQTRGASTDDERDEKMDLDPVNPVNPVATPRTSTRNKTISIEITTPRSSNLLASGAATLGSLQKASMAGVDANADADADADGEAEDECIGSGKKKEDKEGQETDGGCAPLSGSGLSTANGPLTPPQSHTGSLPGNVAAAPVAIISQDKDNQRPPASVDTLHDGGVLWYLGSFGLEGTTVVEEQWSSGRDAVRLLSEDLTDMDDEELNGLGFDVEDSTITAAAEEAKAVAAPPPPPAPSTRSQHQSQSQNLTVTTPKRRGAAGATTPQRKGVRSSARRR
ncbi:hypothetical protein HMPREF1624_06529 [Sporothrix schenckii ATCC 58251]|uniref:NuA3 HAT complex component NTO1 n=1 Tax=Sporothrix schenckii (strain ATCC 58251 / de Perez 2211183) TaxID=1391915 RepID=U7PNI1_SPOS1|nr:hypothetical protein HMPREF1624_06529 [Sporothrix schenckii ATCC 58251]